MAAVIRLRNARSWHIDNNQAAWMLVGLGASALARLGKAHIARPNILIERQLFVRNAHARDNLGACNRDGCDMRRGIIGTRRCWQNRQCQNDGRRHANHKSAAFPRYATLETGAFCIVRGLSHGDTTR